MCIHMHANILIHADYLKRLHGRMLTSFIPIRTLHLDDEDKYVVKIGKDWGLTQTVHTPDAGARSS